MAVCFVYLTAVLAAMSSFNCALGCKDNPVMDDVAGATVRIDVQPESINELITEEISIRCMPKDLPQGTQDLLFIEMGKEGEHPMISVKGPSLKLGSDVTNNMEATGEIRTNMTESFLELKIKKPFVDHIGAYCCRMFYQTEFGELKMGHVYADVTVESNDKAVLRHLLTKVSSLEKSLVQQREYTEELENDLSVQRRYTDQMEKVLMARDDKVSSDLGEIQQKEADLDKAIKDLVERQENVTSAFHVNDPTKSILNDGDSLLFKNVQLNLGGHYDKDKGTYTAPISGLYVFHLVVWGGNNDYLHVQLKVNGDVKAVLRSHDKDDTDQSAISTVIQLEKGQVVSLYVNNGGEFDTSSKYTFFNGYLLKPFHSKAES